MKYTPTENYRNFFCTWCSEVELYLRFLTIHLTFYGNSDLDYTDIQNEKIPQHFYTKYKDTEFRGSSLRVPILSK